MTITSQSQIFGNFLDPIPPSDEFLTLHFSLTASQRNNRWRNYGLSADFLGDYFSAFFPGEIETEEGINPREQIKGSVSYIANELLENAVKYSNSHLDLSITITLRLYEDKLIFEARNPAKQSSVEKYQGFIQRLLSSDPQILFLEQLEQTALGGGESNIGLLTMINDYEADFGWQFTPIPEYDDHVWVTVRAHLQV